MKILLTTVIFEIIKNYLEDFFNSVNRQTYKDFDLLIFNDRINNINKLKIPKKSQIIENVSNYNPIKIRKYLINYAIEKKYDILIFSDADDIMEESRLEKIVGKHVHTKGNYGFYYDNIFLLSKPTYDFFKGRMPKKVQLVDSITKYNFLGLGNTAINIKKTKTILSRMLVSNKIIAFDWYIYTYILSNRYSGICTNYKIFYRIHENNIAGNTNILDHKKLFKGIKVKKYHYGALKNLFPVFENYERKILKLEKFLSDKKNEKRYIDIINKNFSHASFWWENIKTLDELEANYGLFQK
jgi:hypothetical protein